ncbi:hypothetical protein LENED_005392 [Lentinula edodes]|uniref:Uncharacterized protein n=1 Tax=Lentinula edodes TaxID=5353 RepID=A0A1Q3E8V3_LENED|nr:hypothetical protein LENED_005392 [Lentinula edodes]
MMHVTAAVAYLVLLGVGLFSVVCAIHLPTGNDIHPPKPAPPLPKPHYNLRVSFLPHPDLPGEHLHEQSTTPVLAEQMKLFARNLVVAYLNQIRYDSFGWKVNNIDDDIGGALCHPYCLGVVNVPVSTRRAPILGALCNFYPYILKRIEGNVNMLMQ